MNTRRTLSTTIRSQAGFTLLELIVVITIIGILGTMVVMNISRVPEKARIMKIKQDFQVISQVAESYYHDTGSYPESIDEMRAETDANGNALSTRLPRETLDPWGHEYGFELRNGRPVVYCYGKDQSPEGDGENADFFRPES